MPSQEKTKHLGLNQWQGNEYVKRQDFVDDNQIIDSAVETITEEVEAIQNEIYSPQYSDQKTTVASVISMENTVDGKLKYTLKGRTLTNLVQNGNFKDGISGWVPGVSTISATNQIMSITGSGTTRWPQAYTTALKAQFKTGKKYFIRLRARVTNADAEFLSLMFYDSSGSHHAGRAEVSSPVANQWYEAYAIITTTTDQGAPSRLYCRHTYPDAATANGKVMEVQEVIALDLDQYPDLQGLTAEEINAQIPGYIDGMQSVENVKMVSVGKNLFDGHLEIGTLSTTNGAPQSLLTNCRTNFIQVIPGMNIRNSIGSEYMLSAFRLYDNKKTLITSSGNITIPENIYYIRAVLRRIDQSNLTTEDIINMQNSFMIENSAIPTPYEPYQESTMFLPVPLRQLPNGVADTIDSDGNYVRRTNEIILKNSDIFALNTTSTNFDFLRVKKPTDHTGYNVTTQLSGSAKIESFRTKNWTVFDTSENVYMLAGWTLTEYCITFPKGTYANLAAAQVALAGTKVIYELETPVTSKVNIPPLISFKDGTLMFQNRRKHILQVDDIVGLSTVLSNVDVLYSPLSIFKSCRPVRTTHNDNYIFDVKGKLPCYTNPDRVSEIGKWYVNQNGNMYFIFPKGIPVEQAKEQLAGLEIEYETIPYPLPQVGYTYPLNLAAGQQGNTEMIAQLNSVFQDLGEGGEYGTATSAEVMEGYTLGTKKGLVTGELALTGDAAAANVLSGKTFYTTNPKSKLIGTMANRGAVTNTITTQGGQYIIPQGYHNGSGKVMASFPNLIPGNVRQGVNIGGVVGTLQEGYKMATGTTNLVNGSVEISGLPFEPEFVFGRTNYSQGPRPHILFIGTRDSTNTAVAYETPFLQKNDDFRFNSSPDDRKNRNAMAHMFYYINSDCLFEGYTDPAPIFGQNNFKIKITSIINYDIPVQWFAFGK
ncbi:hypothetical protein [Alkaliphilus crotonatoxidans]